MKLLLIITLLLMPQLVSAEMYSWTDSNGVVNYTSDPGNLPNSTLKEKGVEMAKPASGSKKSSNENAVLFVNESIKKVNDVTRQIDDGIKYADEYYEKNRPVSKSVLLSYLNSMSYELGNLKKMYDSSSLNEESKKKLAAQIATFDEKYPRYNDIVNDIDTIEVNRLKTDTQIDYKTRRDFDAYNNQVSASITEENNVFTFTVTISNKGSKADVNIELKGLNYNETSVSSHVIRTSVGSTQSKEISDRIILPGGLSRDISKWVISDVKIVRSRK